MNRRSKQVVSLLGEIGLRRCYYHCSSCHCGHVPWDRQLGLSAARLTPAAAEVASIAGVGESFARSAEVTLRKLAGLRLSESTVERTVESAGQRLGRLLEAKHTLGEEQAWS